MLRHTFALLALSAMQLFDNNFSHGGDIAASISGGTLFLYGDNNSSSISIDSPSNGTIRITGEIDREGTPTTVNGQPSVQLQGWTRGINGYLYNGSDDVNIVEAIINGPVFFDLGLRDDNLIIGAGLSTLAANELASEVNGIVGDSIIPLASSTASDSVTINGTLVVIGSDGDDLVEIVNTDVTSHVTIDTGVGSDEIYIGAGLQSGNFDVSLGSGLTVIPGNSPDIVELWGVTLNNSLIVDDSTGPLTSFVGDVWVGGSAFFYGSSGNDYIETDELNVRYLLRFIMEAGNDRVQAVGSSNHLVIIGGGNKDVLSVIDFDANLVEVFMDQDNDLLLLDLVTANTLNAFGGANEDQFRFKTVNIGRANIYGDSGYDRYFRTPSTSIGTLNLYSIESTINW